MERNDEVTDGATGQERERGDEAPVPPGATGDVEDAVAPAAEGALTQWSPPGQEAGADDDPR